MYNLDERVEGLDVVDFPGVDDRDETISDLADLLLTLSQIVIFVVDYRYVAVINSTVTVYQYRGTPLIWTPLNPNNDRV